jgi:prevent-host-death family protein
VGGKEVLVDTDRLLPISEANAKGISKLVSEAESGHDTVLMRNSRPVAAVVNVEKLERLERLETIESDLRLLAVSLTRMLSDSGNRHSFDDVLAHFDLAEDDLVSIDETDETGE